ncbi:MAG: T9SS type A sorting domain-containing protein [Melioribacteraceae bacterium]|nr:T9SS type A sorting domain-containing protein [Melioribacteraceae bacterium]
MKHFTLMILSSVLSNPVKRIRLNHESMNVNIIGNFDVAQRTTSGIFQDTGWWYDYFSGDSIEVTDVNMTLTLDAGEFRIYTTEKLPTPEGDILSDVQDIEDTLPTKYSLSQNYPNPFNPSTTIKFTIPQSGFVSLKVYNILGQEVKTLLSKEINTGAYSVDWNGTNNYGDQLSSGVYFYRIEAGDFIESKKMLFIK